MLYRVLSSRGGDAAVNEPNTAYVILAVMVALFLYICILAANA